MAQDSNVNLKWDAHQATLKSVFDTLLDTESLADCTVGAEGHHLKAHKVILSACSQYFEQLFRHHHGNHIVIILPGAQFHILKALIQFIYRGEILIQQDELDALLKLADFLQVKGLSYGGNEVLDKKQIHKGRNKSPTYSEHTRSHCDGSLERAERNDAPELLEVSGGSPQSECLQKQDYTKASPLSTPAPKRKKSDWRSLERAERNDSPELLEVSGGSPQSECLQKQDYTKASPLSTSAPKRKKSDWRSPREEPLLQQELLPLSHVFSHNITPQRPELPDIRNLTCDMLSDVEYSSSVTSQLPVCRLGNFMKETVGEELTSAKPLTSVVKTSGCSTESEQNSVIETFTESKPENRSDCNEDCRHDVILDSDYAQCQNLCNNSLATSEQTQSSFCDDESFAQQVRSQEAEWTNTEPGKQYSATNRPFKCTSCDRKYQHCGNLARHQKYECGKEPQFQCSHCAFRCKRKHGLQLHMARHLCKNKLR